MDCQSDWCVAIRRIGECLAAIRGHNGGFNVELKTLLGFLGHEDVLVAYAAKEELRKVLISGRIEDAECINDVVKEIALMPSIASRKEASGFRFQLLRQLVRIEDGRVSEEDGSEDGSSSEEGDQSGHVMKYSYLHAMLNILQQVGTMLRSVFIPVGCPQRDDECSMTAAAPHSVQYEALAFLRDFVKRLHSSEIEANYRVELSELMMKLMDEIFVAMDYASAPTFVSCAVLTLLGDFQKLVKYWKDQTYVDKEDSQDAMYSKWLERCLVWLIQSSCTSTALGLLHDKETSNTASQKAFVAKSSRYPFLQQWLLYLSRIGVACMETTVTNPKNSDWEALILTAQQQLPSRQQLFVMLAEQDDVMIEVLTGLTRMTAFGDSVDGVFCFLTQKFPSFAAQMAAEYDPDLLFADLVEILGRDHLVLLDLLVSNETSMLEYFMRYLRHLSAHWSSSKRKLHAGERLEGVMSVLIRLRLEIDRLVAADLFPYGAGPLTRRLLDNLSATEKARQVMSSHATNARTYWETDDHGVTQCSVCEDSNHQENLEQIHRCTTS